MAETDVHGSPGPTHQGLRALVTGGSRGLGWFIAQGLAHAGADVVIASRSESSCVAAAEALGKETSARVVPLSCHVGRWDDVNSLIERTYASLGGLDILVNNAGMAPLYSSLDDVSEELFDKTIAVNLKGPFRLMAAVGSRMAASGGGAILNISSVAAVRPRPTDLVYAAAKAGLNTLTVGFAKAFGPHVRVNAIMAGPFETDVSKHWDMSVVGPRVQGYPLGRIGAPAEIVPTALLLTGSASSFITGLVMAVDGGMAIA